MIKIGQNRKLNQNKRKKNNNNKEIGYMSTPKIYTSQQFESQQQLYACPRCNAQQDIYIQLGCTHKFCILCITFTYLKYKNSLESKNKIKCLQCQKLSQLDQQLHDLICQVISKQLCPIVKNQYENNQSRMSINQTNIQYSHNSQRNNNLPKQINKSQEQSMTANGAALTPTKNSKCFYSKCESPNNISVNNDTSDSCIIHPSQDISYICMTCGVKALCYKCIKSNKHSNHDVKIVKKAIQVLNDKLSLLNLQTGQKIQNIELYQKRLYDRKLIFEQRIQKSIKQIRGVFNSLQRKIIQKSNEIIQQYQQFYNSKIQQIQNKAQQNSQILLNIKQFQQQVKQFLSHNHYTLNQNNNQQQSNSNTINNINNKNTHIHNHFNNNYNKPSKAVKIYQQIQSKRKTLFDNPLIQPLLQTHKNITQPLYQIHSTIFDPIINYQNIQLVRHINKLIQSIDNMTFSQFINNNKQLQKQQQSHDYKYKYHHPNQKLKFNQTIPYTSIMKSDILFNKNKTMALRNCSSRQNIKHPNNHNNKIPFYVQQNYNKKIKTNVPASLNTSRDKGQKKYNTKTQQDQRRFKSKANYKTQANTQIKQSNPQNKNNNTQKLPSNKQIPTYITKHLQKHQMATHGSRKVSPFNNGTVYLMENMHSSKNNSKLISKTSNILYNDDFNNRKKNNIKDQIQTDKNKDKDKKQMIKSAKHSQEVAKKKK